jgi:hypothetical protein
VSFNVQQRAMTKESPRLRDSKPRQDPFSAGPGQALTFPRKRKPLTENASALAPARPEKKRDGDAWVLAANTTPTPLGQMSGRLRGQDE